jgi:hypothetical protein
MALGRCPLWFRWGDLVLVRCRNWCVSTQDFHQRQWIQSRVCDDVGMSQVRFNRRDDCPSVDRNEVDAGHRHAPPAIYHNPLVQDTVQNIDGRVVSQFFSHRARTRPLHLRS